MAHPALPTGLIFHIDIYPGQRYKRTSSEDIEMKIYVFMAVLLLAPITSAQAARPKWIKVLASWFGYKDKMDPGEGSPLLNPAGPRRGILTNNKTTKGMALPEAVLCRYFRVPPFPPRPAKMTPASYKAWQDEIRRVWVKWHSVREGAVLVKYLETGELNIFDLVDKGPHPDLVKIGIGADLTYAAMFRVAGEKGLKKGRVPIAYMILPDKKKINRKKLLASK